MDRTLFYRRRTRDFKNFMGLEGFNFYKDEDWKEIHKFFKLRLSEFDEFYQEFKDILITLVD